MFEDVPVGVGQQFEGEKVRRVNLQVELGGDAAPCKFELLKVKPMEEVEDGKVEILGPDLSEMAEGETYPIGVLVEVAGKKLEEDIEAVMERDIHYFINWIEGVMHLGSRDIVWMRVSKDSFKKGLNSLRYLGLVLQRLFKAQYPIIEKIQVTFITDEEKVKEFLEGIAKPSFKSRDEKARGLKDEEVDVFYGCTLCQSFAPSHVCIITPNRPSLCGAISWFDARASVKVNPKGHYFPVDKGELIDAVKGEYTGVNSVVKEKSYGSIERVYLYSALECPQSSCGCFEALGFYIPEVDGIGIVNRGFKGNTVNGLAFSTLAGQASGGRQVVGMVGISYTYMQSPKFLQADGGWERVVWMTSEAKERVREFIAPHVVDKIATEKEATNIDELRAWVKKVGHPVYDRQMKELREAVSLLIQKAGPLSLDEVYECFKGEVDKEMIKEVLDKLRGEGG